MKNSHHSLAAMKAVGLPIACLSATFIFALPTFAQEFPNSVDSNTTPVRQRRNPRAVPRVSQQQVSESDPRTSLSPEAIERQTIKQQEAYIQQIEWRRRYGDLDPTPGRF